MTILGAVEEALIGRELNDFEQVQAEVARKLAQTLDSVGFLESPPPPAPIAKQLLEIMSALAEDEAEESPLAAVLKIAG